MGKEPNRPVRTCVACRLEAGKADLVRYVRNPVGAVEADPTGRAPGRGAYLHDDPSCIARAAEKRLLERSLKVRN